MTMIAILPEGPGVPATSFRAVAGALQAVGKTAGAALDAVTSQLDEAAAGILLVVQHLHADQFFTAVQQQRLQQLMERWRQARDAGTVLPAKEQTELDSLVEAELRGAGARAASLIRELKP